MAGRTVAEKVGDWKVAYDAIRVELTPALMREIYEKLMSGSGEEESRMALYERVQASIQMARLISANDRAAGTIAALVTQTGIKPTAVDYGDDA